MRLTWLTLALVLAVPAAASARTMDAGTGWGSAGLGLAKRMGSALGGSSNFLMLYAGGEYTFSKNLSGIADVGLGNLGFVGTVPLRLRLGARYRLADLDLPISPFAQAQLSIGRLYDVIGANLTTFGICAGGGVDYFLTADLSVGGLIALDFSSTLSERSAFFGTVEVLARASYALF